MKIALLFNLQTEAETSEEEPPDALAELDSASTVEAIKSALESRGHEVDCLEGSVHALFALGSGKYDLGFNMCEGRRGRNREAHIPALLEMLGIPYTGSDVLTLALCLDKPMAKKVLSFHNIPTPRFQVFHDPHEALDEKLAFPLFVKPSYEGSSMGITTSSKVMDEGELRRQVGVIGRNYRQPVLVEEFIAGREFTLGVIGNGRDLRFLPTMEIDFSKVPGHTNGIYTHQFKKEWTNREFFLCPAPISSVLSEALQGHAARSFWALGCRDFARVDFRVNETGIYVIEVNPLPGLAPGYSDFPVAAEAAGMEFPELIDTLLRAAVNRLNPDALLHKAI